MVVVFLKDENLEKRKMNKIVRLGTNIRIFYSKIRSRVTNVPRIDCHWIFVMFVLILKTFEIIYFTIHYKRKLKQF